MASSSPLELPVIMFPEDGSRTNAATAHQVVDALEKHGCFMATYAKLELNQRKIINASEEIFHRLDETNYGEPEFAYGTNDQYQSFDIPEATTREGIKNFIPRNWPGRGGQDAICNHILAYTRTAAELEKMVRRILFERYEIPQISTGYKFRMMKYTEVNFGCSDHTNRVFAVLDLNQVDGLNMMTNDGQRFSINFRPSTFLIMAGRPLKDWSNRRIRPLRHRVTMRGNRNRYSVGLFSYYNEQAESSGAMDALNTGMLNLALARQRSRAH